MEKTDKMDISYGYAYSNTHEGPGHHKICARWVPKTVREEHKWAHMEMCFQLLLQYHEGEAFLQQTVTGNESVKF